MGSQMGEGELHQKHTTFVVGENCAQVNMGAGGMIRPYFLPSLEKWYGRGFSDLLQLGSLLVEEGCLEEGWLG